MSDFVWTYLGRHRQPFHSKLLMCLKTEADVLRQIYSFHGEQYYTTIVLAMSHWRHNSESFIHWNHRFIMNPVPLNGLKPIYRAIYMASVNNIEPNEAVLCPQPGNIKSLTTYQPKAQCSYSTAEYLWIRKQLWRRRLRVCPIFFS